MYAQCPECLTVFSFDAATVAQAHGTVACGKCGATFGCLATLTEELPEETCETLPVHPTSPAPPVLMMSVVRADESLQAPLFAHAPPAAEEHESHELPSFARLERLPERAPHTLRWVLACAALALLLGAQLVWAERRPLLHNPQFAPWLRSACAHLGCHLPLIADVDKLQLVSRDVRPHPSVPGALIISATVRNEAAVCPALSGGHDHALGPGRQPHRHASVPPLRLPRRCHRQDARSGTRRLHGHGVRGQGPGQEGGRLRIRISVTPDACGV